MAGAGHIVVLSVVLLGEADVELAVEYLHIERRIARRNARVGDGLHQFEGRVVDLDRAGAEIGGVEQALIRGDRKPLIDRARRGGWYCGFIDGDNRMGSIDIRVPSRNRPVLGREDEGRRPGLEIWVRRRQAVRDIEAGGDHPVAHLAGRGRGAWRLAGRRSDRNDEPLLHPASVVERRLPRAVVRQPEWARWTMRNTPGID